MKFLSLFATLLFGLLANVGVNATTIDFTEVFADAPSSSHTLVGDEWASYGINTSGAYWYADTRDPFDNKGIANESGAAAGVVTFLDTIDSLTVDWLSVISNDIYINVYNSSDVLIDSFFQAGSGTSFGTKTFSGAGIAYLTFHDSGGTVGISTLNFRVPEPGSLLLMGLGLGGLFFSSRRSKPVI